MFTYTYFRYRYNNSSYKINYLYFASDKCYIEKNNKITYLPIFNDINANFIYYCYYDSDNENILFKVHYDTVSDEKWWIYDNRKYELLDIPSSAVANLFNGYVYYAMVHKNSVLISRINIKTREKEENYMTIRNIPSEYDIESVSITSDKILICADDLKYYENITAYVYNMNGKCIFKKDHISTATFSKYGDILWIDTNVKIFVKNLEKNTLRSYRTFYPMIDSQFSYEVSSAFMISHNKIISTFSAFPSKKLCVVLVDINNHDFKVKQLKYSFPTRMWQHVIPF